MRGCVRRFLVAMLLCGLVATVGFAGEGDHLVLFKANTVPSDFELAVQNLGGRVTYTHKVGLAFVAGLTDEVAAVLASRQDVAQVERDESFPLEPIENRAQYGVRIASPTDPTSAEYFPAQWNLPAIHAPEAWAKGRLGSSAVTVAILDTGIDYLFPDLVGKVDLARSVSFVPSDDELVRTYFPGRHLVTDLNTHGTFVSSIVASNSILVAGVTTQTTLMGVKVCGWIGGCPISAILAGLLHAADNGADVANLSLAGIYHKQGAGRLVSYLIRVANYAHAAGMTEVVAAGNSSRDLDRLAGRYHDHCSTPNTLCVSATGPTQGGPYGPWPDVDAFAVYSNYGRSKISVAAPGGNAGSGLPEEWGWIWGACSSASLYFPWCQEGDWVMGLMGTSFSAPHVAGLAALVVEDVGRNPGLVKARIQQGADDLGQPGMDPYYGHGRINVDATVLPQP